MESAMIRPHREVVISEGAGMHKMKRNMPPWSLSTVAVMKG